MLEVMKLCCMPRHQTNVCFADLLQVSELKLEGGNVFFNLSAARAVGSTEVGRSLVFCFLTSRSMSVCTMGVCGRSWISFDFALRSGCVDCIVLVWFRVVF